MEIMINWWAVIVCAIISMVVGMLWYGQLLFGKMWMRVMGVDPATPPEKMKEARKGMGALYGLQFALSILTVYVLAHYTAVWHMLSPEMSGAGAGAMNAFWIWLGFVMPIAAGGAMWSGKPKKLAWAMFLITAGYNLVLFLIFGLILGGWQ